MTEIDERLDMVRELIKKTRIFLKEMALSNEVVSFACSASKAKKKCELDIL